MPMDGSVATDERLQFVQYVIAAQQQSRGKMTFPGASAVFGFVPAKTVSR